MHLNVYTFHAFDHSLIIANPSHSEKKTTVNLAYKNHVCYCNFNSYKRLILITEIPNIFFANSSVDIYMHAYGTST